MKSSAAHLLAAAAAAIAFATVSMAAEVTFRFLGREAWIGAAVTVEIEVDDASTIVPPRLPEVDGATIRLLPGERSSSFTSIVKGRLTSRQTRTFLVEIRPLREGEVTVPPIEVEADGRTFRSEPTTIVANRSETGDLLQALVAAEPSQAYLGEAIEATLRIVIRPFRDAALGLTLSEADMWSLVDLDASEFGVFAGGLRELASQRRRPWGREIEVEGETYFQYDLSARVQPMRAGPPDLGDLRIAMRYPTSLRAGRDFFGRVEYSLGGTRPISAVPEIDSIEIRPLPEEGRPESFTGAVGAFAFEASADPTSVSVGDPITLSLRITDRSPEPQQLELLPAPPIASQEDLVERFRIPPDPLAGSVAGRTKTFTATLRPRDAGVQEIPPLAFSWFDPVEERYRTAWTAPIPLTVQATEQLDLSEVLGAAAAPAAAATPALEGGLHANATLDASRLHEGPIDPDWRWLAIAALPPLAAAALLLVLRRRRFLAAHPAIARAARARRTSLRRLSSGDADAIATALCGYVADCTLAADRSLTSREAIAELERCGVPEPIRDRFGEIVRACERSRFGGAAIDARTLVNDAARCIADLHRLGWAQSSRSSETSGSPLPATLAGALLTIAVAAAGRPAAASPGFGPTEVASRLDRAANLHAEGARLEGPRPEEARASFRAAAAELQQLADGGLADASLEYNLGNALLRAGETGPAILAYLRARSLDPTDERIAANLAVARTRVGDRPTLVEGDSLADRLASWRHLVPLETRAIVAAAGWILLWAIVAARALRPADAPLRWRYAIAAAAVVAAVAATTVGIDLAERAADDRGVVLRHGVAVRVGSGEAFEPAFETPLAAGTEFRRLEARPDWLRIQLADGRGGWIPADAAGLVAR